MAGGNETTTTARVTTLKTTTPPYGPGVSFIVTSSEILFLVCDDIRDHRAFKLL